MLRRTAILSATFSVALVVAAGIVAAPPAAAFQEPSLTGFAGSGVDLTDIVRTLPAADAPVGSTFAAAGTGAVPTLAYGAANQSVPGLQIQLPIRTEAAASKAGKQFATWQPGDDLTVALPAGVTFAAVPTLAVSGLIDLTSLATVAQPTAAVTADLVADNGAAVTLQGPQTSMTMSADKSVVHIRFTGAQWSGAVSSLANAPWLNLASAQFTPATAKPGFLLTLTGIVLSVNPAGAATAGGPVTATVAGNASNGLYLADGYATYPAVAPAQCTVGTVGGTRNVSYVGGATTLAYLPPVALTVAQTTLGATDELQQLPPVSLAAAPGGWTTGATYGLAATVVGTSGVALGTVLFDFPTHTPPIDYLDAVIQTSAGMSVSALAPAASQYGTTRTTALSFTVVKADAAARQAVTIAGLRIAGYVPSGQLGARALPAGSRVQLQISTPAATVTAVNDAATVGCLTRPGGSQFAATPAPAADLVATGTLPVAQTANRVGGMNRYDTAARLAVRFATAGPVPGVVIANGENAKQGFDALAANYLAGQTKSPILLTAATSLPRETAQALRAITNGAGPVTLYVMGKSDSVSDQVAAQLAAIARAGASGPVTVTRLAGNDRYATSVQAAKAGTPGAVSFAAGSPAYKTAILASGEVSADALAAGPLSAALHLPVLLTGAAALPTDVLAAIKQLGIRQIFVLGGADRVSANVIAQARAAGAVVVKRIAGANRFETSADLYGFARRPATTSAAAGGGLGWSSGSAAYLANGVTGFPDALAVGPLAAQSDAALLTTGPGTLDPSVVAFFTQQKLVTVVGLGQPATLALAVITAAQKAGA